MNVKVMHYMSKIGTYMVLYGVLYYAQYFTIGLLPIFNNSLVGSFILFSITSIIFIYKYINISSPYKKESQSF